MAKAIPVYRKDREKLLPCNTTIQQFQQDWRHSFVSRWVRRDQACEALDEQPRSGRPPKVEAAAKLPEGRTAGAMAAKLQQDHHPSSMSYEAEWLAAPVPSGKAHADTSLTNSHSPRLMSGGTKPASADG